MMNVPKTPVSMLQEMMIKKGSVPNYELINNGSGTHQNIFTYMVSCDNLVAEGSGRCKKTAKHNAASEMLRLIAEKSALLQLPQSLNDSPVRTPLPKTLPERPKSPLHTPFHNSIGELADICSRNQLQDPIYEEISDVGPPHARVFTIKCTVSTFKEVGTGTTKRQAKHEAAGKMVKRMKDIVFDDQVFQNDCNLQISSQIAITRYPELSKVNELRAKGNLGIKIKDFYKKLKERVSENIRDDFLKNLKEIEKLAMEDNSLIGMKEKVHTVKAKLKDMLAEIDIEYHIMSLPSKTDLSVVMIQLNTDPDIVEIGKGSSEVNAELETILKLVTTLQLLVA